MQAAYINVTFIEDDKLLVGSLDSHLWLRAEPLVIDRYWSRRPAPRHRSFISRLIWSPKSLHVRFEAEQAEPLFVSDKPKLNEKSIGLWERDVCEIFIAPDQSEPQRYFEFEVAPTGEWLDLSIEVANGDRNTAWDYHSGMQAAARIEEGRILMTIEVPWEAFGRKPRSGDAWLGNIFRCVGREPDRGYLAWSPTMTEIPNFHVPERFGRLIFR